ncbi:hypothetical protein SAMN05444422_11432 [Halobiforma haloterrestris]|uniref:Uncharacterized protein n=1 Tax=Natronobacterium haloterrestre TaxID=148448 RepID=A0A1I1LAL0_NATHA|nr:hypothetical protein SAMN05444422_11432 [Halobiforma haloterrestris]
MILSAVSSNPVFWLVQLLMGYWIGVELVIRYEIPIVIKNKVEGLVDVPTALTCRYYETQV